MIQNNTSIPRAQGKNFFSPKKRTKAADKIAGGGGGGKSTYIYACCLISAVSLIFELVEDVIELGIRNGIPRPELLPVTVFESFLARPKLVDHRLVFVHHVLPPRRDELTVANAFPPAAMVANFA